MRRVTVDPDRTADPGSTPHDPAATGGAATESNLDRRSDDGRKTSRSTWPAIATGAILALLATNGLAWYLLYTDDPPSRPPVTTASPTAASTAAPSADTSVPLVDLPDNRVYGTFGYRGNAALTGEADGGFRTLLGIYWEPVAPGGFLQGDLVSYGRFLYVASETHNAVYAIGQSDGDTKFTFSTGGHMWTGPLVAPLTLDLGPEGTETTQRLIAVSDDGVVYSRSALASGTSGKWTRELFESVRAAPVAVDGTILIATTDGSILALRADGEDAWRYPSARTDRAGFQHAPAVDAGVIHAVDEHGYLHLVSLETGIQVCNPFPTAHSPSSAPLVADGLTLVPTAGAILVIEVSTDPCRFAQRLIDTRSESNLPPAYADHTLYSVEGSSLIAWRVTTDDDGELRPIELAWQVPYQAESRISTAPIVADGVIYFGTNDGIVHAVDADTRTALWTFPVGERVHGGPVIAANAIFVTTEREIFAIAGE